MPSISVEDLKKQLAATESELEQAKAHVYRSDGAIQVLKHFIADAEKPAETAPAESVKE